VQRRRAAREHADLHLGPLRLAHAYVNSDGNSNSYTDSRSNSYIYTYGDSHCDRNGDSHIHTNSNGYVYTDSNGHTNSYANANVWPQPGVACIWSSSQ